jgi:DNA-binding beta-propeller fold protein YncE
VRIPLASDAAGNLHATNSLAGTIVKFTPGGTGSLFATAGLNTPFGLAFDSAGNLYAACGTAAANTIVKLTPDGVSSVFASTGLSLPYGLAFDSAGNLYAANHGNNTIVKFTPDGTASIFASTGLHGT